MMEEEYPARYTRNDTYNGDYTNISAIDSRIEVEPILNKIDQFFSGARKSYEQDKNGNWIEVLQQVIKPPMNETGRFYLMAKISSLLNRANVQGNFEGTHYGDYIASIHRSIANSIIINRIEWGIKENHIKYVVDFVVQSCEPFFTRLKDDKERSHFDTTVKTIETSQQHQRQGVFGFMGGMRNV